MTRKPNIVFITSHDTGRHFGCYGIKELRTPHLDAMASDGVLFENLFCLSPVCCPSRGSMMSGLYPQTHGMMGLIFSPFDWSYRPEVQHLSKILQDRGYHTALFHHQHEVMPGKVEERLSFDEYLVRQDNGISELDIAAEVARYIAGYDQEKPFYAQIGFGLTHRNWRADKETRPETEQGVHVPPYIVDNEAAREDLSWFQGAVHHLDKAVGVILDALNASASADNTIVVFTVDHGIELPRAKWTLFDAGLEVACIMRWTGGGVRGGKRAPQLLSNVDVTPTLLELIGEAVPAYMEGRSFAQACTDPLHAPGRDAIFAEYVQGLEPEARCIRTRTHKFIRNFSAHRLLEVPVDITKKTALTNRKDARIDESYCPIVQLYDLVNDPLEVTNLAGDPAHAAIEQELDGRLWDWLEEVKDPILDGPLQLPAYKRSMADYRQRCRVRARPSP